MPLHDVVWINCTKVPNELPRRRYQVYGLRGRLMIVCVCVLSDLT